MDSNEVISNSNNVSVLVFLLLPLYIPSKQTHTIQSHSLLFHNIHSCFHHKIHTININILCFRHLIVWRYSHTISPFIVSVFVFVFASLFLLFSIVSFIHGVICFRCSVFAICCWNVCCTDQQRSRKAHGF